MARVVITIEDLPPIPGVGPQVVIDVAIDPVDAETDEPSLAQTVGASIADLVRPHARVISKG